MQVMAQSPHVPPLLRRALKANTADADLEKRGGALDKLTETSPAPEQRSAGDVTRSSTMLGRPPQLFHTILWLAAAFLVM